MQQIETFIKEYTSKTKEWSMIIRLLYYNLIFFELNKSTFDCCLALNNYIIQYPSTIPYSETKCRKSKMFNHSFMIPRQMFFRLDHF